MSQQDPATRHLTREELSRVLDCARDPSRQQPADEAKTTVWSRPAIAAPSLSAEPATQLEIAKPRRAASQPRSVAGAITDAGTAKGRGSRAVVTRVGIGLLAAGCAWWLGLRAPSQANESASSLARQSSEVLAPPVASRPSAAVAAPVPRSSPPHGPASSQAAAPSARVAVDLLLSGRMQQALDAYRALALRSPEQPAYAALVAQLEWEIADCEREGASCAR